MFIFILYLELFGAGKSKYQIITIIRVVQQNVPDNGYYRIEEVPGYRKYQIVTIRPDTGYHCEHGIGPHTGWYWIVKQPDISSLGWSLKMKFCKVKVLPPDIVACVEKVP
jgi:hypothetical protein